MLNDFRFCRFDRQVQPQFGEEVCWFKDNAAWSLFYYMRYGYFDGSTIITLGAHVDIFTPG